MIKDVIMRDMRAGTHPRSVRYPTGSEYEKSLAAMKIEHGRIKVTAVK
jgi:hypothetical protein